MTICTTGPDHQCHRRKPGRQWLCGFFEASQQSCRCVLPYKIRSELNDLIPSSAGVMSDYIITADRLFDGSGSTTLQRPVVRIGGSVIEDVQRSLLNPATCSGARVDFPGCTILPGLIDTHVHLIM